MMTRDEVFATRRRAELDDKMKSMIREVLFYVGFLVLLLIVANGQQDNLSYQQNQNLAFTLTQTGLKDGVSRSSAIIVIVAIVK